MMELLNYQTLKRSGYQGYILESAPEKVLQFGEGRLERQMCAGAAHRPGAGQAHQ